MRLSLTLAVLTLIVAPALAGSPYATVPPPEYDHLYDGELHVADDLDLQVMRFVCGTPAVGCAVRNQPAPGHCIIFLARESDLAKSGHSMQTIRRHEVGHCNGWPQDHSGGVLAGTPAPERGQWPSDADKKLLPELPPK